MNNGQKKRGRRKRLSSRGYSSLKRLAVRKKKGGPSRASTNALIEDQLTGAGFTTTQRNYVLQLYEIVEKSKNIATLKKRL